MKHYIPQVFPGMASGRIAPMGGETGRTLVSVFCRTLLSLLLLVLVSNTVFADHHYKGGYFSYNYLGNGRYEVYATSYWDTVYVGKVIPRYTSYPKVLGYPLTVSKTLMPDGRTVKHVQRHEVYMSKPGIYEIYWKVCCRGTGANFSPAETGIRASINYNPEVPASSPRFYDYPRLNFSYHEPVNYKFMAETPEGAEYEFTLGVPYGLTSGPYKELLEAGFQLKKDGTILWEKPVAGKWLITIRLREKMNGIYTGAFIDNEYYLKISTDTNKAPVFSPLQAKVVKAGETIVFETEAADPEGQNVKLWANGSPFDNGAGFIQTAEGSVVRGTFSWTTPADADGTFMLQFVATDDAQSSLSSYLNVSVTVAQCTKFAASSNIVAQPCPGSNNGRISLGTTGGFSPHTYSLDSGLTFQNLPDFENLAAGNFTGIIKDAIGCLSEPVFISLEEAPLPEVSLDLPAAVCINGGPVMLSGESPSGGTFHGAAVANGQFFPEEAGVGTHIIYYTYTDINGCSNTGSDEIVVNGAPVATLEAADTVVYSGAGPKACTVISASAVAGISPYAYLWNTGETTAAIEVCPAETTTYTVMVTDGAGCSDTGQVTITVQERGNSTANGNKPEWAGGKPEHAGNGKRAAMAGNTESSGNLSLFTLQTGIEVSQNPVSVGSRIKIHMEEADFISVEITDLSGRVVKKLFSGMAEAGEALSFELPGNLGKEKFYIGRLITSKEVHAVKIMMQ